MLRLHVVRANTHIGAVRDVCMNREPIATTALGVPDYFNRTGFASSLSLRMLLHVAKSTMMASGLWLEEFVM
jgi:hypothetical protein